MALFGQRSKMGERLQGKSGKRMDQGMSLIEALMALIVVLVVILGIAPLLDIGTVAAEVNQREIEVLNSARQKLEEIYSLMSYDSVGIDVTPGVTSGPGYFEKDPIYSGTQFDAGQDFLLSDTVELSFGTTATRTVTVEAVDDPADDTGASDWDQTKDPRTETILDYKLVRVTATATDPVSELQIQREVVTILRGFLDSEIDGSEGEVTGTTSMSKGNNSGKAAKKGTKGTGHTGQTGQGKGREGRSDGTDE